MNLQLFMIEFEKVEVNVSEVYGKPGKYNLFNLLILLSLS